ncbi:serum response factor-binding protein 1 isoform X2 [Tenrec ecaudatus]|uniref:serum response factor-binding protein 1 isoform X2 n=1 Tax=Tenrec ecaudatus TaxID=94439 RepID=UPI003F5A34EB
MAPPETLNLNNEVVKMRRDVKRIRVLVIRKLVRSVSRLKTKKGPEDALLKNQRRAQRLLEEIHAMKELKPDVVTKSALSDDMNFEKVCKKPDSTATERAIARLAVHPLLKKKTDTLKDAVKAFKEARQSGAPATSNASEEDHPKDAVCSSDDVGKVHHEGTIVGGQNEKEAKVLAKKPVNDSKKKLVKMGHGSTAVNIPSSPSKPSEKAPVVSLPPQQGPAAPKVKTLNPTIKQEAPSGSPGEDDSDAEEKEYFDDSTEERFYKQSSVSEDSDSEDDFFIGKVRRTRKKESHCHPSDEESAKPKKKLPEETLRTHWDMKDDQTKPSTESRKFESVFFNSLSGSKSFRRYEGPRFSFAVEGRSSRELAPKSKTPGFEQSEPQIKNQFNTSKQRRLDNARPQQQLPLHPSWEASRRQKEQQSKIAVFQGKKIKFDD